MSGSSSSLKPYQRNTLRGETAYERHQRQVAASQHIYDRAPRRDSGEGVTTELDVLKRHHKFIREDGNQLDEPEQAAAAARWEQEVAEKFYASLFREFAIIDLKHWKTRQIALRWRTEAEVIAGTGESTCANLRCPHHDMARLSSSSSSAPMPDLRAYETPFAYEERGERKRALVKVVLCGKCGQKMTYKPDRERAKREREDTGSGGRRKRSHSPRRRLDEEDVAREGHRRSRRSEGGSRRERSGSPERKRRSYARERDRGEDVDEQHERAHRRHSSGRDERGRSHDDERAHEWERDRHEYRRPDFDDDA